MLRSFQVIKDPLDYRIIHLLNKRSLSADDLQKVLNISTDSILKHLKNLNQMNFVTCDFTTSLNMWRVSDCFAENNPLFYGLIMHQMQKSPLYQDDLMHLETLK